MSRITEEEARAEFGNRIADILAEKFVPVEDTCPFCGSKNVTITQGALFGNLPEDLGKCDDCGISWSDTDLGDD